MIHRPLPEPEIGDIENARKLYKTTGADVRRTPLLYSEYLSQKLGCNVYLKLENLQRTGSYKIRGAVNCIAHLDPEARIVAASAGNHAQGVAYATALFERPQAVICMPFNAPQAKVAKTLSYNEWAAADEPRIVVDLNSKDYDDAKKTAAAYEAQGYKNVKAFDDPHVIAGQGTVALDIHDQLAALQKKVDVIIAPVGGGGLLSGIAIAMAALDPDVRIYGAESATAAPFVQAYDENNGKIVELKTANTVADGIKVAKAGEITWQVIDRLVGRKNLIVVDDGAITAAMQILNERETLLVEGAGAIALAALVHSDVLERAGKNTPILKGPDTNVVLIVSGGNIDIDAFRRYIDISSNRQSRIFEYRIEAPSAGEDWRRLMDAIKEANGILRAVSEAAHVVSDSRALEIVVEVPHRDKGSALEVALGKAGFPPMPRIDISGDDKRRRWTFRVSMVNSSGAIADFVQQFPINGRDRLTINPLLWHPGAIVEGVYQEYFDVTTESEDLCGAEQFLSRATADRNWRIQAWW